MTAKSRRLDALEDREAARVEAVRAERWAKLRAVEARLSPADRAAQRDAVRVLDDGADPDALARIDRAAGHLPHAVPVRHPAKADAERWANAALDAPDTVPMPCPPADRVADFLDYFEACAAYCDAEAVRVPLSPDVHRLARWGAALWRFDRQLCAVLGGA